VRRRARARARAIELERQRTGRGAPLSEEQADALVAQPPRRVSEHALRRGIEPLHVIDGD
jgi:hypothetical protein